MKLVIHTPKKALKAFLKQKSLRSEIDVFKNNLITLLDKITTIEKRPKDESEEHLKNDLRDFLRDTYYRDTNAINTKDKKDLVIHLDKTTNSEVGVIIEAKRPSNIGEMITADKPNKKALHELILYYLDERNKVGNFQLKQLVITNINEWYIIDVNYFDKHIYNNTQIQNLYQTKVKDNKNNPFFYQEIEKLISKIDVEIPCVYFDVRKYDTILRNNNKEDDRELSALYKIFSPQYLLKITTSNDSNSLNERFYKELLHIIGLEEARQGSKNIIKRKESRSAASLIELTIDAILTEDILHKLPDSTIYGQTKDERIFNVALELCITWINRILFLKLLEGQLVTYHQGNKDYQFLNTQMVDSFDELFKLFHKVLAINLQDRTEAIKGKYSKVPYLNSSLFEISELEDQTIKINSIDNQGQLELINTTILKETKKNAVSLSTIDYLFKFLDAYDFASEGTEDVQEDNKTLITASVLGKVFEKINGYKDGSIFTPAFITMYMCKQSIRLAVIEKFNDEKKWNLKQFDDLYNKIDDKKEANKIINSLKICDPAVGSGHFLVSALNELIAIKSELGILIDEKGKTLRDYDIEIVNDELIITDENGNTIAYNPNNIESNRVQKTLFQEKQTIIENCLFGVDINPNSVKICRLRLWIELLKNAYYKEETNYTKLETLPNIDINIKCGNSLLSRFPLNADLSKALKSIKYDIKAYRGFVNEYKNEKNRDVKRGLQKMIDGIKVDFKTEIIKTGKDFQNYYKAKGDFEKLTQQFSFFEMTPKEKKKWDDDVQAASDKMKKYEAVLDAIRNNEGYKNAFEWRFEFPEVLNNNGEFEGFDLIIGNPPYISIKELHSADIYKKYEVGVGQFDLFSLFIELSIQIGKKNAYNSLIIPDSFLGRNNFKAVRKFTKERGNMFEVVHLDNVFANAEVSSCIYFLKKGETQSEAKIRYIKSKNNQEWQNGIFEEKLVSYLTEEPINSYRILFIDNNELALLKKYFSNTPLDDVSKSWRGEEIGKKSDLVLQKKSSKVFPLITGENLSRYILKGEVNYISMGAIKKELVEYKKEKILIRQLGLKISAALDLTQSVSIQSVYNLYSIEKKLSNKLLLGILNSKLTQFVYQNVFAEKHKFPRIVLENVRSLCIPKISLDVGTKVSMYVDKIIALKQQGKNSGEQEKKIDELVYQLYDLTKEEINMIESASVVSTNKIQNDN